MKALRHAPAAPSCVASGSVRVRPAPSGIRPPWSAQHFERALHPGLQLMVGRLEGQHQHGSLALVGAGVGRLARIEQAAVGRKEAGLRDCANRLGAGNKIGKRDRRAGAKLRPILQAHPGLGDDAENPLGADEHAVGTRPGAGAGQAARLDNAGGREHAHRLHEIVDMRVKRRKMTARAGRDPSAERRKFERLRIVAERVVVRRNWSSSEGPSTPPWIRAAREAWSTSSTRSSRVRSIDTEPR